MIKHSVAAALLAVAVVAAPASAQVENKKTANTTTTVTTSNGAVTDTIAKINSQTTVVDTTGKVKAEGSAARVEVKVAQSLANQVKVSADSAFALALVATEEGKVSSADLEMEDGRLVYRINVLQKNKGASQVDIDAMTGEVAKNKKFGGAKAVIEHHTENKKLLDAKKDSTAKAPLAPAPAATAPATPAPTTTSP